MANWSNPQLTSTYTNFVTEVKDRDVDLALQFDGTSSTNLPTNAIRWNSSIGRWQKWNGSAWGELAATYALTALTTTGDATISGASGTIIRSGSIERAVNNSNLTLYGGLGDGANIELYGPSHATFPNLAVVDANELRFRDVTAATEFARINSTGVGIGTAPDSKFHVSAGALGGFRVAYNATSQNYYDANTHTFRTGPGVDLGTLSAAGLSVVAANSRGIGYNLSDTFSASVTAVNYGITFGAGGTNTIGLSGYAGLSFYTTGTERVRIDGSGRTGFGTANPGTSLDVTLPSTSATIGNVRVSPSTAGQARFHLFNGGAVAEWLFGQKTSTDHNFKLSKSVAGSEVDYLTVTTGGLFQIDSGYGSVATAYGCRAWANIYAGATPSLRASGNISSVTDAGSGVGDFLVSFTTAMPDANYAAVVTAGGAGTLASANAAVGWAAVYATGSVRIGISDNNTDINIDTDYLNVAIFR